MQTRSENTLRFVSSLHIPPSQPSQLISGGGDHSLKVWDWLTGTLQHEIRIDQVVLPYIKVTPSETNRGVDEGEENEKSSGRRKKGKGKKAESEEPVEEVHQAGSEPHSNSDNSSFPEPVLAIGRIGTLQNSSQTYIIWSAIGYAFSSDGSKPRNDNPVTVHQPYSHHFIQWPIMPCRSHSHLILGYQ